MWGTLICVGRLPCRVKMGQQKEVSKLIPWGLRLSKIARERPACCPECGSERVRFEFRFKPTAKQRQATELYKGLFYFGYNPGCCLPRLNSPRVLEAWTCCACGESWDEVFSNEQKANSLQR